MVFWDRKFLPEVYQVWLNRSRLMPAVVSDWRVVFGTTSLAGGNKVAQALDGLDPSRQVALVQLHPVVGVRPHGGNRPPHDLFRMANEIKGAFELRANRERASVAFAQVLDEHNDDWMGPVVSLDPFTLDDLEGFLNGPDGQNGSVDPRASNSAVFRPR